MLTLKQLIANTPEAVRYRSKICAFQLNKVRHIESKQQKRNNRGRFASGYNPDVKNDEHLIYTYTSHCTDGPRRVEIRFYSQEPSHMSQVWVSCSCLYWLYNCEYAVARVGSSSIIYCNGEQPDIKNPRHIPYLCKHLYNVVKYIEPRPPHKRASFSGPSSLIDSQIKRDILLILQLGQATQPQLTDSLKNLALESEVNQILSEMIRARLVKKVGLLFQILEQGLYWLIENS